MNKKLILGIIVLIIAGGIGGFFYFTSKEQGTKGEQGTIGKDQITNNNEQLPEGIEVVVVEGETKTVINKIDSYKLKLLNDQSNVKYSGGILEVTEPVVLDKESEGGGYKNYYNVSVLESDDTLEQWVKKWISEQEYSKDYSYEQKKIGEYSIYIINIPSLGDTMKSLVFKRGNKIFSVDTSIIEPELILAQLEFIK